MPPTSRRRAGLTHWLSKPPTVAEVPENCVAGTTKAAGDNASGADTTCPEPDDCNTRGNGGNGAIDPDRISGGASPGRDDILCGFRDAGCVANSVGLGSCRKAAEEVGIHGCAVELNNYEQIQQGNPPLDQSLCSQPVTDVPSFDACACAQSELLDCMQKLAQISAFQPCSYLPSGHPYHISTHPVLGGADDAD